MVILLYPRSRDNQDQETFLVPSTDKQTCKNYLKKMFNSFLFLLRLPRITKKKKFLPTHQQGFLKISHRRTKLKQLYDNFVDDKHHSKK